MRIAIVVFATMTLSFPFPAHAGRWSRHTLGGGGAEGVLPDLEVMLPAYYQLRDWDEAGVPRPARLEELGLD